MLRNLQSNILKPHGRNYVRHVFLRFTVGSQAARTWIHDTVLPLIPSADLQFNPPLGQEDAGLVCGFFLSAAGYTALGFPTGGFASEAFRAGMKERPGSFVGGLIGVDNKDPEPTSWGAWARGEIHALITLADDEPLTVAAKTAELTASAATVATVLKVQDGNVLRRRVGTEDPKNGEPVEHFGYRDGISQPIFTQAEMAALTETPLQRWNPSARLSLVLVDDPLSDEPNAFGSYLVYRKLEQNLQLFDQRVQQLAAALGVSPALAGAYVVGRFKDGTPVVKADHPVGGEAANDFDFATDDPDGLRCPLHSHVRKTNPRGTTPLTSLANEKRRRIARRGIPYGKPISAAVADFPPADPDPNLKRGLLFMCFQANIEDQFEFIQRTWVDNVIFPKGILFQRNTGDDPLIGQDENEPQRWPTAWGDPSGETKEFNFDTAVTLRGGEYFFAPSLSFLRGL